MIRRAPGTAIDDETRFNGDRSDVNVRESLMRLLLLLVLAMTGLDADAQDLGVRRNASGGYEAVLTMHVGGCGPFVTPAQSVVVGAGQVTITGQDFGPVICGVPPPGFEQTVVTPIGPLSPAQYQLVWSQPGFFSASITFGVPPAPSMVPLASPLTLVVLVLLVVLVALLSRQAPRAGH